MKNSQFTTKLSLLHIDNSTIYKTIHDDISTISFISIVKKLLSTEQYDKFLFLCAATSIYELKFIENALGNDVRAIHTKQTKRQKNEILSKWKKDEFSTIITIRNIYDIDIAMMKHVNIIISMNVMPDLFLEKSRAAYISSMFYFVDFNSVKYIQKKIASKSRELEKNDDLRTHTIDINNYTVFLAKSISVDYEISPRAKIYIYSINCNKDMTRNNTYMVVESVTKPFFYEQTIQLRSNFYNEFLKYTYFFLVKPCFSSDFGFYIFFCTPKIQRDAIECLNLLKKRRNILNSKQKNFRILLKHISRMKIANEDSELYSEIYNLSVHKLFISLILEHQITLKIKELKESII
jgi:hypothetical protein